MSDQQEIHISFHFNRLINCSMIFHFFQHKFWLERTGVSVVAVAPYYIDTPFMGTWEDWTPDAGAQEVLKQSAQGKRFLTYVYHH